MVLSNVFVKVITFPPSVPEAIAHSTALWASTEHFYEVPIALAWKLPIWFETPTEWIKKQDFDDNAFQNVRAKLEFCLVTVVGVLNVLGQLAGSTLPFGPAWRFIVVIFPVTVRPHRHSAGMSSNFPQIQKKCLRDDHEISIVWCNDYNIVWRNDYNS